MQRNDLLRDPMFRVDYRNGETGALSLPAVLAKLAGGVDLEFSSLQAHQMHAWHAFLVQLGAIAMHHQGSVELPTEPAEWQAAILALTDEEHAPWQLCVEDLSLPAFLQPPVPEATIDVLKNRTSTPDEVDILVTSKNHDVKRRRIREPSPEHWAFLLVSLQTTQGFSGKANYGIARMNGGFSNRPGISVARSAGWADRFIRDTALLLETRGHLVDAYGYADDGGATLLWTIPWDGNSSISLSECDPFFIEVCRRIRLTRSNGRITAAYVGTDKPRLNAKELKGNVGDLWTPVRRDDGASLTAKDLSYVVLQDVLFGGAYRPSPASVTRDRDGPSPFVVARVIARGQGGTEGLHERIIPIPAKARRLFATRDGRNTIGDLSRQWVEIVATIRGKILRPALIVLLQGAPESPNFKDGRCDEAARELDRRIDDLYFPTLFDTVDAAPDEAVTSWIKRALGIAREVFHETGNALPIPTARKYRAWSMAERVFEGASRNRFPDAFERKETDENGTPATVR